jgi:hypothetical protein
MAGDARASVATVAAAAAEKPMSVGRIALASLVGTTIEFYGIM